MVDHRVECCDYKDRLAYLAIPKLGYMEFQSPPTDGYYNKLRRCIMSDQDKRIDELEALIPIESAAAFDDAYRQALASGQTLVQTIGHSLYAVNPDGSKHFIKDLEQPLVVPRGTKVKLRTCS
jgi:hypothetical protein